MASPDEFVATMQRQCVPYKHLPTRPLRAKCGSVAAELAMRCGQREQLAALNGYWVAIGSSWLLLPGGARACLGQLAALNGHDVTVWSSWLLLPGGQGSFWGSWQLKMVMR